MFFDYNATSPLRPSVKHAIEDSLGLCGNPSSVHKYGRDVRAKVEEARDRIASYLGCPSKDVIFTSGATEANNMVLSSHKGPKIISAIEHDSLYADFTSQQKDIFELNVKDNGVVDTNHLEQLLQQSGEHTLVAVMAANNETGVIQPIEEISHICQKYQAHLHVDAVQTFGKIPFNYSAASSLAISGHKIGAPSGVGVLIKSDKFSPKALIRGGGQERSYRSGTENTLGIIGLGAAIDAVSNNEEEQARKLRDKFENAIVAFCSEVQIFGKSASRLPNTSNLNMPGVKSELQLMNFDLHGIAVSTGSACSSGKVKSSRVLEKMGVPVDIATTALRVSFGFANTDKECDALIKTWKSIFQKLSPANQERRTYYA